MSGAYFKGGKIVGAGGEGDTDTFLIQNFDNVVLTDFEQVGLVLEATSPISGTTSAKLTHQAGIAQYFKQIRTVSEKFRGGSMTVAITAKSGASLGNVTVLFRDETNNVDIQASQQISATSQVGIYQFGLTVPSNCTSFSYTVTALPEAGSPVTYIDDITFRNYWMGSSVQGQTSYRLDVPVVTEWQSYIPTFTSLGSVANNNFKWRRVGNTVEVKGTVDAGAPVASLVTMTLPNSYTVMSIATSGYYTNVGTWIRSGSTSAHGGTVIVASGNNHVHFSSALVFSGSSVIATNPSLATSMVTAGEFLSIEFSVAVNELTATETKKFTTIDLVPAKAVSGSMSFEVPKHTDWVEYTPTLQGLTFSTATFMWRQNGSSVEIKGKGTVATSAAVEMRIGLPNGYISSNTINSIQIAGMSARGNVESNAWNVLIEPAVNYLTFGAYSGSSTVDPLLKRTGNSLFTTGANHTFSFEASVEIEGLSSTEIKTISSTQSLVVGDSDLDLTIKGALGFGSTNTQVVRYNNANVSMYGDGITYQSSATLGDSFVVTKEGIYDINTTISGNTGAYGIGITKNATDLSLDGNSQTALIASTYLPDQTLNMDMPVNWTGRLVVGDVIHIIRTFGTVVLSSSNTRCYITIARQGSLKQIQTVSDQKIRIPSSEIHLSSTNGTRTGGVFNFTILDKIVGDALRLDQTAGTTIHIEKDGKVDVTASALIGGVAVSVQLTLNGVAVNWNTQQNGWYIQLSAAGLMVKKGDYLRIEATQNPGNTSASMFKVVHQETEIAVSVSNILPQFSESDSSIRLDTVNGYGSVATKIRRFSNLRDNIGTSIVYADSATEGASFTIMESGIYNISYTDLFASANWLGLSRNASSLITNVTSLDAGSRLSLGTTGGSDFAQTVTYQGYLLKGDIIRAHTDGTASGGATHRTHFTISKVGRPNVTGVDVTPFISIPQFEKYESQGFGCTATATVAGVNDIPFTVVKNDLGAFSGTVYTAPRDGHLFINGMYRFSATSASLAAQLYKNGVSYKKIGFDFGTANYVAFAWQEKVKAGDTFNIRSSQSGTTVNASDDHWINFVLEASSTDQILTPPETFSSDTANFVYSTLYDSTTLKDAPLGTFITNTFTGSSNTLVQTGTAPTQTVADMQANGIYVSGGRTWASTGSSATPSRFLIQIGKGYKGISVKGYTDTTKAGEITISLIANTTTNTEWGTHVQYNPLTGILVIDAGTNTVSASTARHVGVANGSSAANGYFVINASKNPALVGINSNSVSARYTANSGQTVPNATQTTILFNVKDYDLRRAYNTSTGEFTAPIPGKYQISSAVLLVSLAVGGGGLIELTLYKNGVLHSMLQRLTTPAGVAFSSQVGVNGTTTLHLNAGEKVVLKVYQNGSGTPSIYADSVYTWVVFERVGD